MTSIDSLPNEILHGMLSPLSTLDLLPIAAVNRRLYTIVLRLLSHRLAATLSAAGGKPSRELILECYPPSASLSTPYLFCNFIGTSHLDGGGVSLVDTETELEVDSGTLGDLGRLYSRFRPVSQEENRRPRRRYPREGSDEDDVAAPDSPPALDVHLDEGESFAQLCTVTNLVNMGSKRGQFLSHANVSENVMRVWRRWLAESAAATASADRVGATSEAGPILWADAEQHVGVRFRVSETTEAWRTPLLFNADDDPAVSYRLEYEELVVRTSQLLLTAERSEKQEAATGSGNAIVVVPTL